MKPLGILGMEFTWICKTSLKLATFRRKSAAIPSEVMWVIQKSMTVIELFDSDFVCQEQPTIVAEMETAHRDSRSGCQVAVELPYSGGCQ
jgi:hypothetical protein